MDEVLHEHLERLTLIDERLAGIATVCRDNRLDPSGVVVYVLMVMVTNLRNELLPMITQAEDAYAKF